MHQLTSPQAPPSPSHLSQQGFLSLCGTLGVSDNPSSHQVVLKMRSWASFYLVRSSVTHLQGESTHYITVRSGYLNNATGGFIGTMTRSSPTQGSLPTVRRPWYLRREHSIPWKEVSKTRFFNRPLGYSTKLVKRSEPKILMQITLVHFMYLTVICRTSPRLNS